MSSIRCIGRSREESAAAVMSGRTTLNGESIRPNHPIRSLHSSFIEAGSTGRLWTCGKPEVSVYLRGDHLDLKGAQCYFWALDQEIGTRWHYVSQPLRVNQDQWGKPLRFRLKNQEARWHRTWARTPSNPASLDEVLRTCDSYGFSFLNFSGEVTGKLSMDELAIRLKAAR
jgi:hypothetical protein